MMLPGLVQEAVIDNSDAEFSTTGNWTEVFDAEAAGGSYLLRDSGDNGTATWGYTGLANGSLRVVWRMAAGSGHWLRHLRGE